MGPAAALDGNRRPVSGRRRPNLLTEPVDAISGRAQAGADDNKRPQGDTYCCTPSCHTDAADRGIDATPGSAAEYSRCRSLHGF